MIYSTFGGAAVEKIDFESQSKMNIKISREKKEKNIPVLFFIANSIETLRLDSVLLAILHFFFFFSSP